MNKLIYLILALFFVASCSAPSEITSPDVEIDTLIIGRHLSVLASDEFMGRKPFTEGEEKTIHYLESELQSVGIKPGNGDSYFQDVPLVEIIGDQSPSVLFDAADEDFYFNAGKDIVLYSERPDACFCL